ncbi:MAG: lysylphosphatidylglycerol synthase transmembrane domain-containing protein [Chitinophagales bacterium]
MADKAKIKSRFWWVVRNILFPVAGVLLLYVAFRGKDYSSIWEAMKEANLWWFFLPRIFMLLSHWARAWRWVLQLRTFGHNTSIHTAFHAVLATFFVNIYLSKVGDFYRCWALKETEQIPFSRSFGTLIMEKLVDLIMLIGFFGLATILKYKEVSGFLKNQIWNNLKEKVLLVLPQEYWLPLMGGFVLLAIIAFYIWRKYNSGQSTFQARIKEIFTNIWQGVISIKNIKNSSAFIALSFFIFLCYLINFQLCFYAMEGTAHLNIIDALFIFATSAFSQAAPIQGNIGAFHWVVSESLQVLKITPEIALAWATAMHATGMVFRIVTGLISVLYLKSRGVGIAALGKQNEEAHKG